MKSDFHMHTDFSGDADVSPELMIQGAIDKGLEIICFTDHVDKDFPCSDINFDLDVDLYIQTMEALRAKYRDKIDIRIGVELGLQPHLGPYYEAYVPQYPFDFVIGSVHVVHGQDPYLGKLFEQGTDEEIYRDTFLEMVEDIKAISTFDVLGHMDYIVRYGKEKAAHYSYEKYASYIDEVLRTVIAYGKGIELNTSGFKYGLGFCHPHPQIIKRYKELGGEIITIGADGHKPEHIAYNFHKVKEILSDCGFKYYTEFKERKPIFKQLP
ncbi:MAG: histidinol-phosphatase HisJ family protein [Lachnospiraceae bacterium]